MQRRRTAHYGTTRAPDRHRPIIHPIKGQPGAAKHFGQRCLSFELSGDWLRLDMLDGIEVKQKLQTRLPAEIAQCRRCFARRYVKGSRISGSGMKYPEHHERYEQLFDAATARCDSALNSECDHPVPSTPLLVNLASLLVCSSP